MQPFHAPLFLLIIASSAGIYYISQYVSPFKVGSEQLDPLSVTALLGLVFILIGAACTLILYHIRKVFNPLVDPSPLYRSSLRQALLFACGAIIILLLSIFQIFNIATVGFTIASMITLEWYFR